MTSSVAPHTRVLSLCSGYGGLELGLRLAGLRARTVCYVEREITAAGVLAARIADGALDDAPIWSDLATFDARPWRGRVDLVTAGYPCQPFSQAGLRGGTSDPRHLWPDVARVIRECAPAWVFLENVANHLRLGFREVCLKLRSMGYRVEAGLYSAEESGANHVRERLFALAYRVGDGRALRAETESYESEPNGDEPGRDIDGCDPALADATRQRRRGEVELSDPRGCSLAVADAARKSSGAERRAEPRRRQAAGSSDRPMPGASVGDVADSAGVRRAIGRSVGRDCGEEFATVAGAGGEVDIVFPPPPDDLVAWRDYLERCPAAQPALRRGIDGSATRVDRLRTLGNGVVPVVAARAFLALAARHGV